MMSYAAEQRVNTVKLHICLVITRYASDIAFRFFFQKAPFHRWVSFYDKSNIKRIENNIARKTFYMLPNTCIHIHLQHIPMHTCIIWNMQCKLVRAHTFAENQLHGTGTVYNTYITYMYIIYKKNCIGVCFWRTGPHQFLYIELLLHDKLCDYFST